MDISVRQEGPWIAEDRSWLASRDGTEVTRSITLDTSAFTANTHYPDGYLPSGMCLGKITATGIYGPYDNTASDGREVAELFLYSSVEMRSGGPDVGGAGLHRGVIKTSRLPANHGLDTAGKADLAAKFRFE